MIYRDNKATGNLRLRHLGDPPKEVWDADGVLLVRRGFPGEPMTDTRMDSSYDDEDLPF